MRLLTALLLIISTSCIAQVYVNGENINTKPDVKICELLLLEDFVVSPNIVVSIDYGQPRKEFEGKMTDATGTKLRFGSAVAAINHLENNGWEYINNSIIQKGRGVIYRYYFRKKDPIQDNATRIGSGAN